MLNQHSPQDVDSVVPDAQASNGISDKCRKEINVYFSGQPSTSLDYVCPISIYRVDGIDYGPDT